MLQFVPGHVDVRFCNFSESVETGLTMAFAEVRRRSKETTNFTVQVSGTREQGGVIVLAHLTEMFSLGSVSLCLRALMLNDSEIVILIPLNNSPHLSMRDI